MHLPRRAWLPRQAWPDLINYYNILPRLSGTDEVRYNMINSKFGPPRVYHPSSSSEIPISLSLSLSLRPSSRQAHTHFSFL